MPTIDIGHAEITLEIYGAGAPLLCVHGFPLDGSMWAGQLSGLGDVARVIVPDLRGFGGSTVSPGVVTMCEFANDLAALLDRMKVDEPVVLCGLSMGGYIAFEFWRRHAGRLRGLILCDTKATADTAEAAAGRRAMADEIERDGMAGIADSMLPRLFAPASLERNASIVRQTRQVIDHCDPRGVAAAQRGMAERADSTDVLANIDLPVLAIVGEHDPITPVKVMRAMSGAMPRAELRVVADAGHIAPLEQPDDVNAAIREFLLRQVS